MFPDAMQNFEGKRRIFFNELGPVFRTVKLIEEGGRRLDELRSQRAKAERNGGGEQIQNVQRRRTIYNFAHTTFLNEKKHLRSII